MHSARRKSVRKRSFVQRLINLDRELNERGADVGARGEPQCTWDLHGPVEVPIVQKLCSNCAGEAEFSVVAVVSTVGMSGRLQQCSPVVLYCGQCLRELIEHFPPNALNTAVNRAYTQLNQRLQQRNASVER